MATYITIVKQLVNRKAWISQIIFANRNDISYYNSIQLLIEIVNFKLPFPGIVIASQLLVLLFMDRNMNIY